MTAKEITKLALFEGHKIRKTLHNNEWWFVVEDVVLALIDSKDSKQYIQRMKRRDPELGKGWVQIVHTLPIKTAAGLPSQNISNQFDTIKVIKEDYHGFAQHLHHHLK